MATRISSSLTWIKGRREEGTGELRLGTCDLETVERLTHHHGLLDQGVTVLTHVLQDLVGRIVASCCGRLGSHREGVDEGLKQTEEHLQRDWDTELMCFKEDGKGVLRTALACGR